MPFSVKCLCNAQSQGNGVGLERVVRMFLARLFITGPASHQPPETAYAWDVAMLPPSRAICHSICSDLWFNVIVIAQICPDFLRWGLGAGYGGSFRCISILPNERGLMLFDFHFLLQIVQDSPRRNWCSEYKMVWCWRVEYVHSKNYLHQDIKPDNFLMGLGRRANQCYIIDFGLAKKISGPSNS